ncbi:hypothetical protein D6C90_04292 [Aureobasidium pullulans]|uniref:DUF7728 domain-containing protein n=1 Tax=Aureobasidium pullulans TaxID=5580 RepID=A0A4V4KRI3_AURPU|nr:hypothetical protein D6C90_04292 [Aureobasidium pullulans]
MLGRTVGALAALSIGANAILLPPGISKISDSRSGALGLALDPKSQAVKVHCSGCAFPSPQQESVQEKGDDDIVWIQGGSKDVIFNFTVDDNNKDLLLNGVKVYPVDTFSFAEPTVGQIHSSASLADIKSHPEQITPLRVSSAGMQVHKETISSVNDMLVSINYQISELESQSMAVDGVDLKLLEGADGSLMIISVDAAPMKHMFDVITPPGSASKECSMLPASLCKWKSVVEDKISGFKPGMPHAFGGCGGRGGRKPPHRLPGHIRPHFDKPADAEVRPHHPHGPGDHPHPHHGPHGMHRGPHHGPHHHRHHHFFPAFVHAFVAVLIPVMTGVTMGMFVSLIGMLVGRLISFMWIKFGRGGQRGYASVAQSEQDTENAEKGVVVIEDIADEEPLPKYEDAPAYDEKDRQ